MGLTGHETFQITGLAGDTPGHYPKAVTVHADNLVFEVIVRVDTEQEQDYHRHGGIMPYVMRSLQALES